MRVVFEGTPDQVLRDMQDYIARMAMMFGESEERPEKVTAEIVVPEKKEVPALPPPASPCPKGMTLVQAKRSPKLQTCRFCMKEFERLLKHAPHCEKNPNRIPHPKTGVKTGPRGRNSMSKDPVVQKYIKGGFDGEK